MTVIAIQSGLDPDAIDYPSPDFAQHPHLCWERLRSANRDNVASVSTPVDQIARLRVVSADNGQVLPERSLASEPKPPAGSCYRYTS
jgi:hypothetical protein